MMQVRDVSIAGYRSLRALRFPVGSLTVFVGANGVGKTNLYRSLQLLQAAAAGTLARELASEGGMELALWAGKRMVNKPARIKLAAGLGDPTSSTGPQGEFSYGVEVGVAYSYEVDIGIRMPTAAAFPLEPQIKDETLTFHRGRRPLTILERRGPRVTATDADGRKQPYGDDLLASETALGALQDPARFPDIDAVRRTMLDWRFFHDFRSDRDSPLRRPCLAVTTPTLASDGSDLAAVFATLVHIREDTVDLDRAIDDAFPGRAAGRAGAGAHRALRPHAARLSQAGVRCERTVRRHAALSGAGRRAARLPAAGIRRAQRAGDEPASRPARAAGAPHHARCRAHAGMGRDAFGPAGAGFRGCRRRHARAR